MPPMAEYHDTGAQFLHTPDAAVSAGDVIPWGGGIAVIIADQEADRPVGAAVEGTFEFTKATGVGTAMALGAEVGWDEDNEIIVPLASGDRYAGRVMSAVTADDTLVLVKINAPAAVEIPE